MADGRHRLLEIENSQYFHNRSTDRDKVLYEHARFWL